MSPRGERALAGLAAGAWGLLGALACAALVPLEPNLLEEGFALHVAQRIAAGEHMYRDVVFFSGPAPFEALALLFRLLGDGVFVARGAVVVLHGLATGLLVDAARRAGAGPFAHAAGAVLAAAPALLFPLYSIYYHATVAVYLALLATWAAVRALEDRRFAVAAGVLVALVAISKQSVGAVLALALLGALAAAPGRAPRRGRVGGYVLGGVLVAALTLLGFGLRGDLEALIQGMVVLPFTLGETFRSPYINFWPPGELSETVRGAAVFYLPKLYFLLSPFLAWPGRGIVLLSQVLFALPWLALAWTAIRLLRSELPGAALVMGAGLVGVTTNLFPRADWGHLVAVLPLALVQLGVLAGLREGSGGRARATAAIACLLLLGGAGAATLGLWGRSREPRLGPRVPLRPVGAEAEMVGPAVDYLLEHTEPGEALFVARAEPLLYYATGTRNPTPYEGIVPGFREAQEEEILAGLPEARYVVMSDVDQPFMTFYADELPRVHAYLERHFRIPEDYEGVLSPVIVLERGPDRGPASVDLGEWWLTGRPWLREADGQEQPLDEELPRLVNRLNRRPFPVVLGPRGGGIDIPTGLPLAAVFEADVGLRGVLSGSGLLTHPRPVELRVLVAERAGEFELAGSTRVGITGGRRWRPFRVDLSRWGGREVTLRLEAVPLRRLEEETAVVWWGSPRIVERPPARGGRAP